MEEVFKDLILGNDTNDHQSISAGNDSFNQRHNSTDFDTFCRQITESAISDDGKNFIFLQKKIFYSILFQCLIHQWIKKTNPQICQLLNHLQIIRQIVNSDQSIRFDSKEHIAVHIFTFLSLGASGTLLQSFFFGMN